MPAKFEVYRIWARITAGGRRSRTVEGRVIPQVLRFRVHRRRAAENVKAAGLSPSTISRLCKDGEAEHERFRTRWLRFHRYAYLFVDGVHVSVRLGEDDRLCLLVVIGVREDRVKELLAVEDGYRESDRVVGRRDARPQGARTERAEARGWRRSARHVGRVPGRVPGRAQADLLGAQDRARARRAPQAVKQASRRIEAKGWEPPIARSSPRGWRARRRTRSPRRSGFTLSARRALRGDSRGACRARATRRGQRASSRAHVT
jgi:hypothetical protein